MVCILKCEWKPADSFHILVLYFPCNYIFPDKANYVVNFLTNYIWWTEFLFSDLGRGRKKEEGTEDCSEKGVHFSLKCKSPQRYCTTCNGRCIPDKISIAQAMPRANLSVMILALCPGNVPLSSSLPLPILDAEALFFLISSIILVVSLSVEYPWQGIWCTWTWVPPFLKGGADVGRVRKKSP